MARKIISIASLIAIAFALLPAVAAFAAAGSATLEQADRNIFPKADQTFDLTVTNNESAGGLLGMGAGQRVRYISVDLPLNTADAQCATVPQDWTCKATNRAGRQPNILLSTSGQGLAQGASMPVQFLADVNLPAGVNRAESFAVYLSADGTQFDQAGGNTGFTVHGLELVQGISINELRTDPGNIYPNTRYTSGQLFRASFDVINRSQSTINVSPRFESGRVSGTLVSGATSLAAGQRATYTFEVNTAGVTSGRTVDEFDGAATGSTANSSGDAVSINNGTTANITETSVEVEGPAQLTLGSADTVTVNGENRRLAPVGSGVEITIDGTKSNFPGVDLSNGSVPSDLTLTIPGCSVGTCSTTASLAKVSRDGNDIGTTMPRLNGGSSNLRFHYVVDFTVLTVPTNARTPLDARFRYAGTDDNAFAFGPVVVDLNNLLVIDLAAPIVELDAPLGNVVPERVADGNTVTVSGTAIHDNDLDTMTVTLASSQNASNFELPANQRVDADTNRYRQTVATQDDLGAGYDCPAPYTGRTCQDFSVSVTLPGSNNAETEDTFALGFSGLGVIAQGASAIDTAGNPGLAIPATDELGLPVRQSLHVDNDHPDIIPKRPVVDPGNGNIIGEEALAFYIQDDFYGPNPVVRVSWTPGSFPDLVEGGCRTNHWSVDGVNVTEVRYADNTVCGNPRNPAANPPAYTNRNDRILVLDGEIDPALNTVNFEYIANGGTLGQIGLVSRIVDSMQNRAYNQSGVVIDGRIPNIPELLLGDEVRLDTFAGDGSRESAGVSTDDRGTEETADDVPVVHTNVNDLQINVAGAILGTDDLQIVQIDPSTGQETQLARIPTVAGQGTLTISHSDIQLATCAGSCQARTFRAFRFIRNVDDVDTSGNPTTYDLPGPLLRTDFLFDTGALTAKRASLSLDTGTDGSDVVSVDFGEEPNAANDIRFFYASNGEWISLREVSDGANGDAIYANDRAQNVFNTATEVTFEVDYTGEGQQDFHAAAYEQILSPENGFFIEDLAGNLMASAYEITPDGRLTVF